MQRVPFLWGSVIYKSILSVTDARHVDFFRFLVDTHDVNRRFKGRPRDSLVGGAVVGCVDGAGNHADGAGQVTRRENLVAVHVSAEHSDNFRRGTLDDASEIGVVRFVELG